MEDHLNRKVPVSKLKNGLFLLTTMFCLTVLSACGLSRGPYEPIRSYVLDMGEGEEWTPIGTARPLSLPSLLISLPQPAPGFESPRMAYEQVPHEVRYFATSRWVDSPARMLAPLITNTLERSEEWSSVSQLPSVIRGDYRLDISQVTLIQEFTQQPSRIRLALRAQLMTVYDPHVVGTRNFEFREEALSEDAYGGVQAAQKAVQRLLVELKNWLQGCLQSGKSSHC